jgi:hypothetical protein
MKKPPVLPDRNAPLRPLTAEESRIAFGGVQGIEVTSTATYDDVVSSGVIKVFGKPGK